MDELLYKPVYELTDEEWKKVQQLKNTRKPSVQFSKASLNDCMRPDGLALDLRFSEIIGPSLHIPQEIIFPVPSDFLCEHLLTVQNLFVLNNEKSCRMLIDAILIEVLKSEFNDSMYGVCEVKNDWEGTGFGYTGDVDYMIGSSITKSVDTMDSFLIIVEAKKEWPDSGIPQVRSRLLAQEASGCWKEHPCICRSNQWHRLSVLRDRYRWYCVCF